MSYQPLFDYMSEHHGVNLLETDMQEICRIVKTIEEPINLILLIEVFVAILKNKKMFVSDTEIEQALIDRRITFNCKSLSDTIFELQRLGYIAINPFGQVLLIQ